MTEEMETKKYHKKRHTVLHEHLDELVADYIVYTNGLPSKTSVMKLMEWSAAQVENPTAISFMEAGRKMADNRTAYLRGHEDGKALAWHEAGKLTEEMLEDGTLSVHCSERIKKLIREKE